MQSDPTPGTADLTRSIRGGAAVFLALLALVLSLSVGGGAAFTDKGGDRQPAVAAYATEAVQGLRDHDPRPSKSSPTRWDGDATPTYAGGLRLVASASGLDAVPSGLTHTRRQLERRAFMARAPPSAPLSLRQT